MAAPDPLKVRGYNLELEGHTKDAQRALSRLQQEVRHLRVDGNSLGDAQRAAVTLTELITALSALKASQNLRFLTEES